MKKLLYLCAALMCLAIAAGVIALSGAGALRLLRASATDAPTASHAAKTAVSVTGQPAPETPVPAPKAEPLQPPAPRVYTVDLERVMKTSAPGKAVLDYADRYEAVMTQNIGLLDSALKNKRKRYDTRAMKNALAQFTRQKSAVRADARNIIMGLIRSAAAASPLNGALLIDRRDALYLPDNFDKTDEVIALIDKLKLNLPEPPKPIRIE